MSETPELPPLDREDDVEGSLGWNALNYRTAASGRHAQSAYEDLENFVQGYGRKCLDAGRRAGLEEAAKEVEVSQFRPVIGVAKAIRAKAEKHQPCPRCLGTGDNLMHDGMCGECGGTGRAKP